ncbi:MAG: penicillin-binding protein activator [candidate division KSB1 bacterium]|nr:penicillin-binding protein activator [candidate division KSB1 bacterium]
MKRIFGLLTVLVLLGAVGIKAQPSTGESSFQSALILFRNGEYENAEAQLLSMIEKLPENPKRSSMLLLLSKIYLDRQEPEKALRYADLLLKDYPSSRYCPYAHFYKAQALNQKNDRTGALVETAYAVEFAEAEMRYRFEAAAAELVRSIGAARQIEEISRQPEWSKARPILLILAAQANMEAGDAERARALIDQLLAEKTESRYRTVALKLKEKLAQPMQKPFRVGLLMPLSGYFSEEAEEFLAGAALALKLRRNMSPPVELYLGDTAGSVADARRLTQELVSGGIDAIIGELEADKSSAIAELIANTEVPLLMPTATETILTAGGNNLFQLNSPIDIRGRALAAFAVRSLGAKTFAMLTPEDEIGRRWAEAFAAEVARLGGVMVCRQTYHPDSTNFSSQLEAIREAGFRYSVRQSLTVGGRTAEPSEVDRVYEQMNQSARRKSENRAELPKQTRIPMQAVDAVFIPMNEAELPFIASQYALYNIKAQLLAGDQVYNLEKLREQQSYLNKMIFVSGFYFSEADLLYKEFVENCLAEIGHEPTPMTAYGYNAVQLILDGLDEGNRSGAAMKAFLAGVKDFEGVGTFIRLNNPQRVNQFVNILQFVDGNVFRLNTLD